MSKTMHDRRGLVMKVLLAAALMAGMLVTGTGTAHATPAFTINGQGALPYEVTGNEEGLFLIEGTGYDEDNIVVVALCNRTRGGHQGTHCDGETNHWTVAEVDEFGEFSAHLEGLTGDFEDFNFQTGSASVPATDTECHSLPSSDGQCAIQVVEYTSFPPSPPPVSVRLCDVDF